MLLLSCIFSEFQFFSIFVSSGVIWVRLVIFLWRCWAFWPWARSGTGLVVWDLVERSSMLPWSLVKMSVISLFFVSFSSFATNASSR